MLASFGSQAYGSFGNGGESGKLPKLQSTMSDDKGWGKGDAIGKIMLSAPSRGVEKGCGLYSDRCQNI